MIRMRGKGAGLLDYTSTPLELVEIKAGSDGTMQFSAYASTFGNVDHGGDVIEKGAFRDSLKARPFRPLLWQHDMARPIGIEKSLREDSKGLLGTWELVDTVQGTEAYKLLKAGAVRSMSIGYIPTKWEYEQDMGDGGPMDRTRILKSVDLLENSVVSLPMNEQAQVTNVKHMFCHECLAAIDELDAALKATWTTAYVNSLPDSAFALVYTDSNGNKQRKLPHHNKDGALDLPHLRNALSRAPQMTGVSDAQRSKAVSHLERHASAEGIGKELSVHEHDDEDSSSEASSFESMTLAELASVTAEIVDAFGVRTRDLIAKLNAGDFSLNESKRTDLQKLLETFSGLDVARRDVETVLAQKSTTDNPSPSALALAIEVRRRKMRARGMEI
jgi:Escherichia/Staphylococcus phage prohead protease